MKSSMKGFLIPIFFLFIAGTLTFPITSNPQRSRDSIDYINLSISEDLIIDYFIESPVILGQDMLNIYVKNVSYTSPTGNIPSSEMEIYKYHIYSGDINNLAPIREGNLEWYNQSGIIWRNVNINLAWTGQGKFFVTVEFKTYAMTKSYETTAQDNILYSYERYSTLEIIIIALIIIGAIIGVVILFIVIRMKKQELSMKRTSKVSKKEIKVSQISKDELKKSKKKAEKKEHKEKGKTEVKEDLIFSVPKWEIDEDGE